MKNKQCIHLQSLSKQTNPKREKDLYFIVKMMYTLLRELVTITAKVPCAITGLCKQNPILSLYSMDNKDCIHRDTVVLRV